MSLFSSIWKDAEYEIKTGNIVATIILVNALVFVCLNLVLLFLKIPYDASERSEVFRSLMQWIAVPYNLKTLLFRPWTLITHMFVHVDLLHVVFNMLFLYWFSRVFKIYMSDKKILPIYVYGGLCGAFLAIAAYNLIPSLATMAGTGTAIGASAGVLAIVMATATLVPDHQLYFLFIGQVRIKYIALAVIVLNIIYLAGYSNLGGTIAHFGGIGFGFFFIKQLQAGNDLSIGFNKLMDSIAGWFKPSQRSRVKVVYKSKDKAKKSSRFSKSAAKDLDHQSRIDQILDKISQSGYDSLSKEDKDFLFKVSNEDKPLSD